MDGWKNQAGGTPFMVTEFYTKGEDTKLDNSSGAGFVVRDQQNRGTARSQELCRMGFLQVSG